MCEGWGVRVYEAHDVKQKREKLRCLLLRREIIKKNIYISEVFAWDFLENGPLFTTLSLSLSLSHTHTHTQVAQDIRSSKEAKRVELNHAALHTLSRGEAEVVNYPDEEEEEQVPALVVLKTSGTTHNGG